MSLWIEIHCDVGTAPATPSGGCGCYADSGRQVGGMAMRLSHVPRRIREIGKEAREQGWRRRRNGSWICPACLKAEAK